MVSFPNLKVRFSSNVSGMRIVRPLTAISLASPDGKFSMTLDGGMIGHSVSVASDIEKIKIKPILEDILRSECQRISIAVLQNNGKLAPSEGSADDPSCWTSTPLMKGLNTVKITVTANVTKSESAGAMPEYKTQVYVIFINQIW